MWSLDICNRYMHCQLTLTFQTCITRSKMITSMSHFHNNKIMSFNRHRTTMTTESFKFTPLKFLTSRKAAFFYATLKEFHHGVTRWLRPWTVDEQVMRSNSHSGTNPALSIRLVGSALIPLKKQNWSPVSCKWELFRITQQQLITALAKVCRHFFGVNKGVTKL